MKVSITNFYNIRFFKENQIPVSTAAWDPKWYFKNKQGNVYADKRRVVNGLRINRLALPQHLYQNWCSKECDKKDLPCPFMKTYKEYLKTLNFEELINELKQICKAAQKRLGFCEEPEIVLMVHESVKIPCAERPVIIEWFKENGWMLEEWKKKEC